MRKHIWKKSFSISFVFHLIVVITIGAMLAGFHQEIQRPKEELITVNLADTPEQIAKAQAKEPFGHFSQEVEKIFNHDSDNDNQSTENDKIKEHTEAKTTNNVENSQLRANEISAEDGILPSTGNNSATSTNSQSAGGSTSDGDSNGSENSNGSGDGFSTADGTQGNNTASTEDRYSVASRFAQAVEAHKSYPYAAVRLNQQGTVIVNVTIDANGNLINADVVSSVNGNLDKAALNAVYSACPFSHGLGESISMNVPVNFYLN